MINGTIKNVRDPLLAIISVIVAYSMSLALRRDMFLELSGAQGVEATYHVLWTALTLNETSPSVHRYLPTVTLDPETSTKWGGAVPTPEGAYIYTSFPPLGFVLPAIVLRALDGNGNFEALANLNSLVGLIAALAMGGLVRSVILTLVDSGENRNRESWIIFALCAITYIYTRESLVSHGAVVWVHSLSQLCLIAGCYLAFRVFTGKVSAATLIGLFIVSFLYPSLEWTGFVFNLGLVIAFLWIKYSSKNHVSDIKIRPIVSVSIIFLSTLMAGMILSMHLISTLGFSETIDALSGRAVYRAYRAFAIVGLPLGYFSSFGILIPLAFIAFWILVSEFRDQISSKIWLLIFVSMFPLLENVIMMQHAYQFSFDRLKLAVPIFLICSILCFKLRLFDNYRYVLMAMVVAVIWSNVNTFSNDIVYYKSWGNIHRENVKLSRQFADDPLKSCGLLGTRIYVRGYMNMTFRNDIVENVSSQDLMLYSKSQGRCATIYIHAIPTAFEDLPELRAIDVYDASGSLLRRYENR